MKKEFVEKWGLYKGDAFEEWIDETIQKKVGQKKNNFSRII